MRFSCPNCQQAMEVADSAVGQKVACPCCAQRLQVPAPPPTVNKTMLGALEPGPGQHVQSPAPPRPPAPAPGGPRADGRSNPPPPRAGGEELDPSSRSRRRHRDENDEQGGWEDADYRPRHQESAGLAIASMVCGIVGTVIFFIWFVAAILGLVAIILGFVHLNGKNQSGRGMAKAGVATGFAAIALVIILLLLIALIAVFWSRGL